MLRAIALSLLLLALQACAHIPQDVPALCDTDTDCMRFCDPADLDCDGGPQSANS